VTGDGGGAGDAMRGRGSVNTTQRKGLFFTPCAAVSLAVTELVPASKML
jgi:hypothetical protein